MTAHRELFNEWLCWSRLGWFDILSRYRRTVFGPIWIVLMTATTVVAIGTVYSAIFRLPVKDLLPFVAIGIVVWVWISTSLIEACSAFSAYKFIMTNQIVRPSSIIVRVVTRNVLILAHNALVVVALLLYFQKTLSWTTILVFPAMLLLVAIIFPASIIFAYACSRFRDLTQVITSIFSLLFLITPIIWSPELLGDRYYIAQLNPFTHLLDLVRQPLLGSVPPTESWVVAMCLLVFLTIAAMIASKQWRHRMIFWL